MPTKKCNRRGKKVVCVCQNPFCGGEFEALKYEVETRNNGKYCSPECVHMMQRISVPDKVSLTAAYESGLSTNDLAIKFKLSKGTIYNLFKAYDLKGRNFTEAYDAASKTRLMGGSGYFKGGRKDDIENATPRSMWEANVLRWLNYKGIEWEYEPRRFNFPLMKTGAKSYLPDLWLPEYESGRWVEIKGQLRRGNKTQITRFKKFFPEEFAKLMVIPGSRTSEAAKYYEKSSIPVLAYYKELDKEFRELIPYWNV